MREFKKSQAEKPDNEFTVNFGPGIKPENVLGADVKVKKVDPDLSSVPPAMREKLKKQLEQQRKGKW